MLSAASARYLPLSARLPELSSAHPESSTGQICQLRIHQRRNRRKSGSHQYQHGGPDLHVVINISINYFCYSLFESCLSFYHFWYHGHPYSWWFLPEGHTSFQTRQLYNHFLSFSLLFSPSIFWGSCWQFPVRCQACLQLISSKSINLSIVNLGNHVTLTNMTGEYMYKSVIAYPVILLISFVCQKFLHSYDNAFSTKSFWQIIKANLIVAITFPLYILFRWPRRRNESRILFLIERSLCFLIIWFLPICLVIYAVLTR